MLGTEKKRKKKKKKKNKQNIQSMAKQHQMFMVLSYFKVNLLEHETPNCITSQKIALKKIQCHRTRHSVAEDKDLIIAC